MVLFNVNNVLLILNVLYQTSSEKLYKAVITARGGLYNIPNEPKPMITYCYLFLSLLNVL